MSADIALNDEHKIEIVSGDLKIVRGKDYIIQNIRQSLQLGYNEAFLDRTRGIAWQQEVFKKGANITTINAMVSRMILSVDGVKKINSLNFDLNDKERILTIEFNILTIYGNIYDSLEVQA